MNPYTTMSQARIHPRDFSAVLRANGLAGASLAGLERQRGCQAEAEVGWLLKQNGGRPRERASRVALLRRTIGTGLVRAGERLGGVPRRGIEQTMTPEASTLGMAG